MGTRGRPPQVLLRRIVRPLFLLAAILLIVALAPMAAAGQTLGRTVAPPAAGQDLVVT